MIVTKVSLIIFVIGSLSDYASSWVFTEINPRMVNKGFDDEEEGFNDNEDGFNDDENGFNDIRNDFTEDEMELLKFNLIYPGTKWCGAGNVAENYDDLGSARETDMCCREHDNCPDLILAGETKFNLTNKAYYTRLSCGCDLKFRECLHEAKSSTANHIGKIYFNILGTKCYKEDYPITGCKKKSGWFRRKCVQYTFDKEDRKAYQWFDVPNY